jgi:hypothetical protein
MIDVSVFSDELSETDTGHNHQHSWLYCNLNPVTCTAKTTSLNAQPTNQSSIRAVRTANWNPVISGVQFTAYELSAVPRLHSYAGSTQTLGHWHYVGSMQTLGHWHYVGSTQTLGHWHYVGSMQTLGHWHYVGSMQTLGHWHLCGKHADSRALALCEKHADSRALALCGKHADSRAVAPMWEARRL